MSLQDTGLASVVVGPRGGGAQLAAGRIQSGELPAWGAECILNSQPAVPPLPLVQLGLPHKTRVQAHPVSRGTSTVPHEGHCPFPSADPSQVLFGFSWLCSREAQAPSCPGHHPAPVNRLLPTPPSPHLDKPTAHSLSLDFLLSQP